MSRSTLQAELESSIAVYSGEVTSTAELRSRPRPALVRVPFNVHFVSNTRYNTSDSGDASRLSASPAKRHRRERCCGGHIRDDASVFGDAAKCCAASGNSDPDDLTKGSLEVVFEVTDVHPGCDAVVDRHAIHNKFGPGKNDLQAGSSLLTDLSSITPQSLEARTASPKEFSVQEQCKSFAAQSESAAAATLSGVKCHLRVFAMISARILTEMDEAKQGPNVVTEGCPDMLRSSVPGIDRRPIT